MPDPTWRVCRPVQRIGAIISWSMVKRSGPATRIRRTGFSAWSGPTRARSTQGFSFLLLDMQTSGISTRPIRLISGYSFFCETFFDNVKVPKANLVGELNKGWEVAKYLLGHERESISGMGLGGGGMSLADAALMTLGQDSEGRLDEPVLRARIALFEVRAAAFRRPLGPPCGLLRAPSAAGVERF